MPCLSGRETIFNQLMIRLPRVMFASITTTNANHGSPELRQALLGVAAHSMISGIRFISITPNWNCLTDLPPLVRAFDGGSRQTLEIEQALVARYHASLLDGMDKFEVHMEGLRLYFNEQSTISVIACHFCCVTGSCSSCCVLTICASWYDISTSIDHLSLDAAS